MTEYVSRQALIKAFEAEAVLAPKTRARAWAKAINYVETEQGKTGEWLTVDFKELDSSGMETTTTPSAGIKCTNCQYCFLKSALWARNFCPNCGAEMVEGAK